VNLLLILEVYMVTIFAKMYIEKKISGGSGNDPITGGDNSDLSLKKRTLN